MHHVTSTLVKNQIRASFQEIPRCPFHSLQLPPSHLDVLPILNCIVTTSLLFLKVITQVWIHKSVFLSLFIFAPLRKLFRNILEFFFQSIPQHRYTVLTVYVIWSLKGPQTIIISKIFFTPTTSFHPTGGDTASTEMCTLNSIV